MITSFQRPSNITSACSVTRAASAAADDPVYTLLFCMYLTFLSVLAILAVYGINS